MQSPMAIFTRCVLMAVVAGLCLVHAAPLETTNAVAPRDGAALAPHSEIPVEVGKRAKRPQALNGHDAREDINNILQAVYRFEDALDDTLKHVNDYQLQRYKLSLLEQTLQLNRHLQIANAQLSRPGSLTLKAIGRIRPLLQSLRAAVDRTTQVTEQNVNVILAAGLDYIPRAFVYPYIVHLRDFNKLIVAKTDVNSRQEFDVNTEALTSDLQDIQDHFAPFVNAQEIYAAQAKAGDPKDTRYDLRALYNM